MIMKNVAIRKALVSDLDSLLVLCAGLVQYDSQYDPTLSDGWASSAEAKELFTSRITEPDGIVLVAIVGDKIVGYLLGGLVEASSYRKVKVLAELEELFVLDEFRRYSIGAKLIAQFDLWCQERHPDRVHVVVSGSNAKAIAFYKRHGFYEYNAVLEKTVVSIQPDE